MKITDQYRYLWDGTEPGWVLNREVCRTVNLTLVFGASGPRLDELAGVRRAVPTYASLSASAALAQLRGKPLVDLGEFEPEQALRIVEACRKNGCQVREQILDRSGYLPFNEETSHCLIIEDDDLAKEVYEEALRHGIRVRQK